MKTSINRGAAPSYTIFHVAGFTTGREVSKAQSHPMSGGVRDVVRSSMGTLLEGIAVQLVRFKLVEGVVCCLNRLEKS
jgi:hypothetical protein